VERSGRSMRPILPERAAVVIGCYLELGWAESL
jgi:hypothetical protein